MLKDRGTTRVLSVSAGLFFALGLLAAIGPSLPELARNNGISLAAAGSIFTALFLGAIPAEIMTGWLTDKFGPKAVLISGTLVLAVGLLGATASHTLPLTLACMLFAGLGDGVLIVGANVIVAQSFSRRRASALNLLNVFFGVGAITGPAVVGASIGIWETGLPALWALAAVLILIAPMIPGLRIAGEIKQEEDAPTPMPLYRSPILWIFSFLLLLYVGTEVGTGGWIATYMQRTTQTSPENAALAASAFYFALTAGRVAAAGLGTKLSSERLLLLSLVGAVIGGISMSLEVGNGALTIAAIMVLGWSFGPVFPTAVAIITAHFPVGGGRAASVAIAAGSVGGTLIPLLQGALLDGVGAQALAQLVVAGTLGMLLLLGPFNLTERRSGRDESTQTMMGSPPVAEWRDR